MPYSGRSGALFPRDNRDFRDERDRDKRERRDKSGSGGSAVGWDNRDLRD